MAHYKYDRLSAQDNDFLLWEKENLPMHGGSTSIFDSGALANEDGGIDFATIKRGIHSILHKLPRYRQKISWIPGTRHAIWVDDPDFNLDYHLRHTSLPRPGSEALLKQLVSRIVERPLDRSRPLWEMWVVEGLEGNQFALVGKTHHCVVDGSGGMTMAKNLFGMSTDYEIEEPHRYIPRPWPTETELRRDEWLRLAGLPFRAAGEVLNMARHPGDTSDEIVERVRALGEMASLKVIPASDTPLNGPVGPHRVLDWFEISLADVKAVRRSLECSVNDVVLATITGAVRDFLIERQTRPDELEFRVATPVNVRRADQEGEAGNHVSSWIVSLPVSEPDPLEQVAKIRLKTQELKDSHQFKAVEMVEAINEWISIDLQALSTGTQNMYVTNVPGPSFPLYLLGAELKSIFIQAPLIDNLGVAVAALSYNGKVCFGFTADYDRVPDISDFASLTRSSFERLAEAARINIDDTVPVEVRSRGSESSGDSVADPVAEESSPPIH
jgi:diacylglycerol O-acyltransferase